MATDYKQYNYSATYAGGSFAGNACGPTAVADLLNISPLTVANWMTKNGYASNGNGTYWSGISAALNNWGGGGVQLNSSSLGGKKADPVFTKWQKHIQSGYMGILLMGNRISNYWTNGGHFIAVVSYQNGKYLVYDPASVARSGWHPFSDFAGNILVCYTSTIKWKGSTTSTTTTTTTASTTYTFTPPQIKKGATGPAVILMQRLLRYEGKYKDSLDGIWGNNTEAAVRAYQKANKLAIDGICGPATWASLLGITGSKKSLAQIQYNSKGQAVKLLQKLLRIQNMYVGVVDGIYGPATRAGVVAYQKSKKLSQDGVCGPKTWKSLIGF